MASIEDVRRITAEFPRVTERTGGNNGGSSWRTNAGMLAWERPPRRSDLEQLAALGREWPDGVILGIRVDGARNALRHLLEHRLEEIALVIEVIVDRAALIGFRCQRALRVIR